jgi:integrase
VAGARCQENDLIFPSSIGTTLDLRNLLRNFKEILKAARLPDMRFHDLRHTAASLLLTQRICAQLLDIIAHEIKSPLFGEGIYRHLWGKQARNRHI